MEPQCRSVIVLPLFTSCFETGSLTAAEALTQRFSSESSKCWDYRCEPTHLVQVNGTAGLLIVKGIEQFSCISWQFYSFLLLVIHDCQLEPTVGSQKTWSWFSLSTCKWVLRMKSVTSLVQQESLPLLSHPPSPLCVLILRTVCSVHLPILPSDFWRVFNCLSSLQMIFLFVCLWTQGLSLKPRMVYNYTIFLPQLPGCQK